jgi:hypothetical protein
MVGFVTAHRLFTVSQSCMVFLRPAVEEYRPFLIGTAQNSSIKMFENTQFFTK